MIKCVRRAKMSELAGPPITITQKAKNGLQQVFLKLSNVDQSVSNNIDNCIKPINRPMAKPIKEA